MGYSITFHGARDQHGEAETFFLCSVGAWSQFGEWAESLPKEFVAVKSLFADGECEGTDRLAEQLAIAMKNYPPVPSVRNTVRAMLKMTGVGDSDETATLTD